MSSVCGRWQRLSRGLAVLALVCGWLLGPGLAQAAADAAVPVELTAFDLLDAQGRPTRLTLPTQWRAGEIDRVHLRAEVELAPIAADVLWALRFDRLPPDHDLRVNGHRVSGHAIVDGLARRFTVRSRWVEVPAALLRPGRNEVTVEFALNQHPGGLSAPWLGPADALQRGHRLQVLWGESLPFAINVAAAGLSLFVLMVWWLRRTERVLGFFGVLWLLVSLRNMAYYVDGSVAPTAWSDFGLYAAQCVTTALLAGLALAVSPEASRRRWAAAIWLGLLALGLTGLAAVSQDQLPLARRLLYPVLMGVAGVCFLRLWKAARHSPGHARSLLAAGLVMLMAAAVHDYLFNTGWLSISQVYWVPYLAPLLMVVASQKLLTRFVQALDMAERHGHDLEQRVAERTRELQSANAAKTRFVAAASHDLRQPVASIGLLAGLLREQSADSAHRSVLDRLTESVGALEQLLKGLLDLSRFDAGTVVSRPRPVVLRTLFDAVAAHERDAAAAKGLRLRMRPGDLNVHADPVLLEQIVRNLVSNAVRYTERGGVLISARRRGPDRVLMQVWDTGCGIPADRQASVFDEYVRIDTAAQGHARGLGLGLSLVRRAAKVLEAPLRLRSQQGRGSCFSLTLPLGATLALPRAAGLPARAGLDGRRIVLVDDDEGMRESLRMRLESWGARVQAYTSVAALSQALRRQAIPEPPHLLLSDQGLPDGDARDVQTALARHHPGVPTLIVTGDTAPADLARLEALHLPVLHKPFGADALFDAVLRTMRTGDRQRVA